MKVERRVALAVRRRRDDQKVVLLRERREPSDRGRRALDDLADLEIRPLPRLRDSFDGALGVAGLTAVDDADFQYCAACWRRLIQFVGEAYYDLLQ